MSEARVTLVVATTNRGKLGELRRLLDGVPVDVVTAADALFEVPVVHEDGATFEDNALRKARAIAQAATALTLADDSGLEVDALGGRPGVRSARFAHARATDAENNAALLSALDDVPPRERGARFRCVLALVDPWAPGGLDAPVVVEGRCEGSIAREPRGAAGFGYDPLFVLAASDRTLAELSQDEKNRVSHRAAAFDALRPKLLEIVEARRALARAVDVA